MPRYSTSHVVLTAVHSRRSCSGHICHIAPEKAQAPGVGRAMGAGVNEKQVGGMLARPSPVAQYLPHEYAIVVSSERQAGDGCYWGRNKWRMLRAKRLERAPGRLRHSRRLHHRCDGGPLVSRWDASSSSAPPTPRARSLLICERLSRKQGARRSWSMSASARRAATSTLCSEVAAHHSRWRIFWAAPIAAAYRSAVISPPVQKVWAAIRDFNALPAWHPAIVQSEIERELASDAIGCVRSFSLQDGGHLREQLLALSDVDHSFTYNILVSPMPVKNYVATFRLTPIRVGKHLRGMVG